MPMLSLFLKALAIVVLQFFYRAQSLVVVDYSSRFQRGRRCQWREKQKEEQSLTRHGFLVQSLNHPPIWGRSANVVAFASAAGGEDRSLKEILDELTDREIAFSPLASRAELEELLVGSQSGFSGENSDKNQPSFLQQPLSTKVSSVSEGLADMEMNDESRIPSRPRPASPPIGQKDQQKRQIQDRIERRANRMRKSFQTEGSFEVRSDSPSSPTSRQNQRRERQRPREGETSDRSEQMWEDVASEGKERTERRSVTGERRNIDTARLRKRRRRERLGQKPPSLLDSITENSLVNEVIGIGSRAGRIAKKKTGKLWNGLVDSTYDDDDDDDGYDYDFDTSGSKNRRERRRSGFNWQQESRNPESQRRRRRKESFSSTDERGRASRDDSEIPSASYYYSDEKEITSRDDISEKQRREQKRQSRKNRQQRELSSRSKKEGNSSMKAPSPPEMRTETQRGKLPIGQILSALNERNISYSPRASRKDLEDLLLNVLGDNNVVAVKNAEEDNIQVIEVESISPEDWKRQQEEKLRQKQKEQEREEEQKQKKMKQQEQANAKKTSGKPNSRQEQPKDSTTGRTANFYRSVNRSYRPSGFSSAATKAYASGPSTTRQGQRKQRSAARSAASAASSSSPSSSPKNKPREQKSGRRIYSPFRGKRSESTTPTPQSTNSTRRRRRNDFGDIRDDFDRFGDVVEDDLGRFGELLANSVDNIFWGAEDDDKRPSSRRKQEEEGEEDDDDDDDDESSNRRRNRKRKKHWKDRAEERLDKVMGIHSVGDKTYDRWTERDSLEEEEEEEDGYDAISYAKGRRRRNRSKTRKAFWEEDASIFSVLLGHNWDDSRPPQRSLRSNVDDIFGAFRSSRTLTALLRNVLVVTANLIGSLCKWASVRDTIPRPFVFLGGVGAGFVSPPGSRIKNTLLAFLSIRVLGEWLSEPYQSSSRKPPRRSPRAPRNNEKHDDGDENEEASE